MTQDELKTLMEAEITRDATTAAQMRSTPIADLRRRLADHGLLVTESPYKCDPPAGVPGAAWPKALHVRHRDDHHISVPFATRLADGRAFFDEDENWAVEGICRDRVREDAVRLAGQVNKAMAAASQTHHIDGIAYRFADRTHQSAASHAFADNLAEAFAEAATPTRPARNDLHLYNVEWRRPDGVIVGRDAINDSSLPEAMCEAIQHVALVESDPDGWECSLNVCRSDDHDDRAMVDLTGSDAARADITIMPGKWPRR